MSSRSQSDEAFHLLGAELVTEQLRVGFPQVHVPHDKIAGVPGLLTLVGKLVRFCQPVFNFANPFKHGYKSNVSNCRVRARE